MIIESLEKPALAAPQRFTLLYSLLVLVGIGLMARSFYLQVWRGREFLAQAEGNHVISLPIQPPRGLLYDRNNEPLVENIATTDAVLDPATLPGKEDEAPLLDTLPSLLHSSVTQVQEAIEKTRRRQRTTVLTKALDHDTILKVEETLSTVPGVRLTSSLVRHYFYGSATAHIVGYTSPVTAEELATNPTFESIESTGKSGIEARYNAELRGILGATYTEINAAGHPLRNLGTKDPQPGADLQLTIDIHLQRFITDLLRKRAQEDPNVTSGAVVALDPRSGEILAAVSYPSFDPNVLSQPSQRAEAQALFSQPYQPFFNRVTDGMYPPGSTIKPLLAAAALQEGIITPSTTVFSTGGITVGPWSFSDWKPGGHGLTNITKAIAESVNTFFYVISGGFAGQRGLGVAAITRYLGQFGWGKPSGIDLPAEAAGFLPSPQWKEQTKHERWYIGDTYHLGIGQGDVLVTPLQLSRSMAALANGGTLYTPHLVKNLPLKKKQVGIGTDAIAVVQAGMRQTVTDGSARSLATFPLPLAGKTGTAQIGGTDKTHAWFTSFGPFNSPELVITVLLEGAGQGDQQAVPVARSIWQWWLEHKST